MAGDLFFDAIRVKGIFCKNEVCLLSRTPVGKAISDEKNEIIFFSVGLDELLFASPAKAALFPGVRERNTYPFALPELGTVCVEWDFFEMVHFKDLLYVEIEAITDDFYIDTLFATISVKNGKRGVDVGMLFDKTKKG